ncbi:MAG: dual specificity protein phosphatase family protein [Anaerolineae bacterium]|nr:dual specificity protein phosphatase family protein [Anaerolineae bacterium]
MNNTPYCWPKPLHHMPLNLVLWSIVRSNHVLTGVPIKSMTHITSHLFVGGKISRAGWERLESWGVSALVNLRVEFDDRALGIRPDVYLWLPTVDGTPPTLEQLDQAVRTIRRAVAEGRKVYIHCAAGVGRAPTTAAAYLVTTGMTVEEAVLYIRQRRPIAAPGKWQRRRLSEFAQAYDMRRAVRRPAYASKEEARV